MLIAAGLLVAGVALLFVPLLVIRVDTGGHLTSDPADVSHHQVALVLGAGLTAKGTPDLVPGRSPGRGHSPVPHGQGRRPADVR